MTSFHKAFLALPVFCLASWITALCPAQADEMTNILGPDPTPMPCGGAAIPCAGVPQLPQGSGNYSTISQTGNSNSASIEQQAILGNYANVVSLNQNGNNNGAVLSQANGAGNYLGLNQTGNGNTATLGQTGSNLGLQVNQSGGSSIGVTQFGTGTAGAMPITITQSK